MAKGIRFFGTDFNNIVFGGTVTASSGSTGEFAFDGLISTRWLTTTEGTDGNAVSLEMDYGLNRTIDSFYLFNTNIDDFVIAYWDGAMWVDVDGTNATITIDATGLYAFAKLTVAVTTQKVRVTGSNTITPNNQKYVTQFLGFSELGQLEYFPTPQPSIEPFQSVFKTTDGKAIVIDRGEAFKCKLDFKSHVNQNDINLVQTLLDRKESFYMWINGGDETIFSYTVKPYRFRDIYKVAIIGKNKPQLTKNYYKAGMNNSISVTEVT